MEDVKAILVNISFTKNAMCEGYVLPPQGSGFESGFEFNSRQIIFLSLDNLV